MLARVLNRWFTNGFEYEPGDLVQASEELIKHLASVNIMEEVTSEPVKTIFEAIVTKREITPKVRERINLVSDDKRFFFRLKPSKDAEREEQYRVPKKKAMRVINL